MEIFFEVCGVEPLQIFLKNLWWQVKPQIKKVDFEAVQWFFRSETDSLRGSRNTGCFPSCQTDRSEISGIPEENGKAFSD